MRIKVGSLFDGIGGAPLSAVLSGAEPVWASEIEKVPISITKRHFPNMKHYGDITQINGAEIEPVDIIVGGSPCQDLSVAGKRAGLEGARSGLFMDQVRIVKEMRNATRRETSDRSTELPRPRYMVWENVPGAFSSNKGEDFRAVLEETARVADPTISIPRSVNGWANAGSILADRFSISWRTFDAQYWGVPQRRRRIYLVADFGGHTAPEILFESEGMPGNIAESRSKGQGAAEDAERRVGSAGFKGQQGSKAGGIGFEVECAPTVLAGQEGHVICFEPGAITRDMGVRHWEEISPTLRAEAFDNRPAICVQGSMIGRADHNGPQGSGVNEDVSFTLNTVDRHAVCYDGSSVTSPTNRQNPKPGDPCHTLGTDSRNYVCYGISSYHSNSMKSSNPNSGIYEADTSKTIDQNGGNPACNQGGIAVVHTYSTQSYSEVKESEQGASLKASGGVYGGGSENFVVQQVVRRLTPLECERLQGYPDGWTALDHEDKAVSDTQRYKALGNSFAVPNALFVISRCVKQLQKEEVNERD